ncbi:hypothetical protein XENOCAPTIV_005797 [Xenoophorus captivus]|uniref:Phosphatidic acid phosphatase type 2/haloperoxidase domain-containing protein n=1 Tax=Xenoophorus captivus TaxID=1517983 RepID=A0ABV0R8E6_9TELE
MCCYKIMFMPICSSCLFCLPVLSLFNGSLQMYVTLVFKTKGTRLTKPTISLTVLCLAMLVGVVRVAEYRNHWADVLAGFFTGGAISVFLVTCVINNFQQFQPGPPPLRPQRPESMLGMPMVTLPCVESPLEKLSGPQVRVGLKHNCANQMGEINIPYSAGISVYRDHMTISPIGFPALPMSSHRLAPFPAKSRPAGAALTTLCGPWGRSELKAAPLLFHAGLGPADVTL